MLPEQLPNESAKAYAAFVAYAEMGTQRSLEKVQQKYDKSTSYIRVLARWSAQHRWQERVREYDAAIAAERAELLRQQRHAEIERLRSDSQADAANLRKLARGLNYQLDQAIAHLETGDIEPRHMAGILRTIAQALETATNLDAAALGIDEALQAATGGIAKENDRD
jgi:hypothetical protein